MPSGTVSTFVDDRSAVAETALVAEADVEDFASFVVMIAMLGEKQVLEMEVREDERHREEM